MMQRVLFILLGTFIFGGCLSRPPPPPESAVISADSLHTLDAVEKKAAESLDFPLNWQKGDSFSYDNPDEKWYVRSRHRDRVVMVSEQGVLQVLVPNPFVPAVAWQGPKNKGRRKLSKFRGSLYPLEVGKRLVFEVEGQSDRPAQSWNAHWLCDVTEKKLAPLPEGRGDTEVFVVVCESNGQIVNFNYSPELDHHLSISTNLDGQEQVRNLTKINKTGP